MNVTDIVDAVAAQTGLQKVTIKKVLTSATQVVAGSLSEGNSITVHGLGFFFVKQYPPRKIYNPTKKKIIMSAGTTKGIFKLSPKIKCKNSASHK